MPDQELKIRFMKEALMLAQEAGQQGEIPVGAVIVKDGTVIARGRNRRESGRNALYHAEMEAIDQACRALGGWRLWQCEMYVTLEPCPMCAGAILNARIPRLFIGARDEKYGACGSALDLMHLVHNFKPQVETGILEESSMQLLSDFFKKLREELSTRPKWQKPESTGLTE